MIWFLKPAGRLNVAFRHVPVLGGSPTSCSDQAEAQHDFTMRCIIRMLSARFLFSGGTFVQETFMQLLQHYLPNRLARGACFDPSAPT